MTATIFEATEIESQDEREYNELASPQAEGYIYAALSRVRCPAPRSSIVRRLAAGVRSLADAIRVVESM